MPEPITFPEAQEQSFGCISCLQQHKFRKRPELHGASPGLQESGSGQISRGQPGNCTTVSSLSSTATDKLGTVLSAALFGTISRNHICSVRNAVTVGTVDLVVHLDCLYVLCPLAQLVRPWRNWLTIRHRAVHFQTFEGSASSPPLVGICHRPT